MMSRLTSQTVFLVLFIYLSGTWGSSSGVGEPRIRCKEAERQALLKLKEHIYEYVDGLLSSWGKEEEKRECCEWIGIRCDNKTGHVIRLDLSFSAFGKYGHYGVVLLSLNGSISSLAHLKYLGYLDLSDVMWPLSIGSFIGSLGRLRYLNLSHTDMRGEIPPQLGNLSSLEVLDLSGTDVDIRNLDWLSRLSSLRSLGLGSIDMSSVHNLMPVINSLPHLINLELRSCGLSHVAPPPPSLVNSSKFLASLDLSDNSLSSTSMFKWLYKYNYSLVHLELHDSGLNSSFLETFGNNMAALEYLSLANNVLDSIPKSFGNMTALSHLDLSNNQLEGYIPEFLGSLTAFVHLDLSSNKLEGSIPKGFGDMASLEYLDLHDNMLEGEIPESIWRICALRLFHADNNNLTGELRFAESSSRCAHFPLESLNLEHNKIIGSLPNFTLYQSLKELLLSSNRLNGSTSKSIGHLSQLEILDISGNSMADVMFEAHFSKLFNLRTLDFSSNSLLVLNLSSHWIPPFQLYTINLRSCKLGPQFPKWLLTQKNCSYLDISHAQISDYIPDSFFHHLTELETLNMSYNEIRGTIKDEERFKLNTFYSTYFGNSSLGAYLKDVDLSSNLLEGSIPHFLLVAVSLKLFKNQFSDLKLLCKVQKISTLSLLDVSYNILSGEIPDCWSKMRALRILMLGNNNLFGKIPASLGLLISIETLHLGNNNFTGALPSSLQNCKSLIIFDLEQNQLSGQVPAWIGTRLTNLIILSLRSNNFNGSIPEELCHLVNLRVLDLSSNTLSGLIPSCLQNLTSLKEIRGDNSAIEGPYGAARWRYGVPFDLYRETLFLWKGALYEFTSLGLLRSIDFSSNRLTGEIPKEITELIGLISLNLSRNNISGQIPQEIGRLKSLDLLDLSNNQIFGQIPSSLSQIDRLSTLDLSSNNLSGEIPKAAQLEARDAAAYMGNPELCGYPLPRKCPGDEEPTISPATNDDQDDQEEDEFITKGFYISSAVGFIVAFWGVSGTLICNKSWRYKSFKFFDEVGNWVFVAVAVQKKKLLRMHKRKADN